MAYCSVLQVVTSNLLLSSSAKKDATTMILKKNMLATQSTLARGSEELGRSLIVTLIPPIMKLWLIISSIYIILNNRVRLKKRLSGLRCRLVWRDMLFATNRDR